LRGKEISRSLGAAWRRSLGPGLAGGARCSKGGAEGAGAVTRGSGAVAVADLYEPTE